MEGIESELAYGNTVVCANCPTEIRKGDVYHMRGGLMYCSQECGDEEGEGWIKD